MRGIEGSDVEWLQKHEVDEIKDYKYTTSDSENAYYDSIQEQNKKENEIFQYYVNNEKKVQDEADKFLEDSLKSFDILDKLEAVDDTTLNQIKDTFAAFRKFYQETIKKYDTVINPPQIFGFSDFDAHPLIFYTTATTLEYKKLKVEELITNLMTKYGITIDDETIETSKQR